MKRSAMCSLGLKEQAGFNKRRNRSESTGRERQGKLGGKPHFSAPQGGERKPFFLN